MQMQRNFLKKRVTNILLNNALGQVVHRVFFHILDNYNDQISVGDL